MQIRSITLGADAAWPLVPAHFHHAGALLGKIRAAFEHEGVVVQTTRICTQPAHRFLSPASLVDFATALERLCGQAGIDFCAVGGIVPSDQWSQQATSAVVSRAISATERVFSSIQYARDGRLDFSSARAAAETIETVASTTDLGFGNLRFAALANCPPNTPFFPAAYHAGGPPRFSLAVQFVDVVQGALSSAASLDEARTRLRSEVQAMAVRLEAVASGLEQTLDIEYAGIDLSPAPYPTDEASIAGALEALGVQRFGGAGTLLAAAILTDALRQVKARQCGFSGLMLPLLEDSVLARRLSEGVFGLSEVLLWSSVCGTGLDTVPLPGDVSADELAAILLDVGAMSIALNKPLTARLLPVPGKRAGDATEYDFPFFANSRVLGTKGYGASGLIAQGVAFGR